MDRIIKEVAESCLDAFGISRLDFTQFLLKVKLDEEVVYNDIYSIFMEEGAGSKNLRNYLQWIRNIIDDINRVREFEVSSEGSDREVRILVPGMRFILLFIFFISILEFFLR